MTESGIVSLPSLSRYDGDWIKDSVSRGMLFSDKAGFVASVMFDCASESATKGRERMVGGDPSEFEAACIVPCGVPVGVIDVYGVL